MRYNRGDFFLDFDSFDKALTEIENGIPQTSVRSSAGASNVEKDPLLVDWSFYSDNGWSTLDDTERECITNILPNLHTEKSSTDKILPNDNQGSGGDTQPINVNKLSDRSRNDLPNDKRGDGGNTQQIVMTVPLDGNSIPLNGNFGLPVENRINSVSSVRQDNAPTASERAYNTATSDAACNNNINDNSGTVGGNNNGRINSFVPVRNNNITMRKTDDNSKTSSVGCDNKINAISNTPVRNNNITMTESDGNSNTSGIGCNSEVNVCSNIAGEKRAKIKDSVVSVHNDNETTTDVATDTTITGATEMPVVTQQKGNSCNGNKKITAT